MLKHFFSSKFSLFFIFLSAWLGGEFFFAQFSPFSFATFFLIRIFWGSFLLVLLFLYYRKQKNYTLQFPIFGSAAFLGLFFYFFLFLVLNILLQKGYLSPPAFLLALKAENPPFYLSFLAMSCVGVLLEEFIFRGLLFDLLQTFFPPWAVVFWGSLLFTLLHGQYEMGWLAIVFVFSLALNLIRNQKNGFYLCILIHFLHNTLTLVFL